MSMIMILLLTFNNKVMNFIDLGCFILTLYFLFFTDEMENTIEFTVLTEVVYRGIEIKNTQDHNGIMNFITVQVSLNFGIF